MAEAIPSTLGQRYHLLNLLGEGGMGRVYRAIDRLTGQVLALKRVLVPTEQLGFATRTDLQTDFHVALAQEFQLLCGLRHPSIIGVLDYGFDSERQPFLTMELIEGAQTVLEAAQDQPLVVQVELLMQLLQALSYLHRRDVVHRDLKPSNVLVKSGRVKVLDFGISIMQGERSGVSGTLSYMAPEILLGKVAGVAADLYAVGVIAFELLAARPLFNAESPTKLIKQILETPLDELLFGLDSRVATLLQRLLAKNPQDRFSSASEAMTTLNAIVNQPLVVETVVERESFLQTSRLVGRETEVGLLSTSLTDAIAGLGSSWLIGGESGIGKSRLLDELRTLALVNGTVVLRGYAASGGSRPYEVWREPLRRLILSNDLDNVEAGILKTVIPDISNLLERKTIDVPNFDSESIKARLLSTIANVFKRCEQPMLVLLENLHWADEESLDLLALLVQMAAWLPLMIVGSYRDEELPNLPARLPEMQVIRLKRLSPNAIAELSRSMLGTAGSQARIVDLLQRETEGNPFFLIEVVRALAEEAGRLDKIGDMELPEHVFTGGVRRIIERRLSRVTPAGRPLLQISAVSGNRLDLAVLSTASPTTNMEQWITDCAGVAVLEMRDGRWHFAHDKLRIGLIENLDSEQLRTLHQQVATAIEQTHPNATSEVANLAFHWHEAQDVEKEGYYVALAGEQALRSGAYQTAVPYLERALVLASHSKIKRSNGGAARLHQVYLERQLAEAYYGGGELVKSREHQENAMKLLGFPIHTVRARLVAGIARNALIERAYRLLPARFVRTTPDKQAAMLEAVSSYAQLVQIYYFIGEVLLLIYANLRGLNLAQAAGAMSPAVRAQAYANMGISCGFLRLHGLAEKYNRRARETVPNVSDLATVAWVLQLTGTYDLGVGQWAKAQEALTQAVEIADRIGHKRRWQEGSSMLATVFSYQGDFARTAQIRTEISTIARRESTTAAQAWVLLFETESALLRGEVNEAVASLDEVTTILGDNMSRRVKIRVLAFRALANLYMGDQDSAQQAADMALQVMEPSPPLVYLLPAYTALAEVYVRLWEASGQSAAGKTLKQSATRALQVLKKGFRAFPINQPSVWRIQGDINWLSGDLDDARKAWQKSLSTAEQLTMPYEQALAHYEIARHLDTQNPVRQEHVTRAAEIFARLGAIYQLARIRML